jgi:hypothetical protein
MTRRGGRVDAAGRRDSAMVAIRRAARQFQVTALPPSLRRRLPRDAGVMKPASDGSGTTVDIAPLRLALSAPPPVGSGVSR